MASIFPKINETPKEAQEALEAKYMSEADIKKFQELKKMRIQTEEDSKVSPESSDENHPDSIPKYSPAVESDKIQIEWGLKINEMNPRDKRIELIKFYPKWLGQPIPNFFLIEREELNLFEEEYQEAQRIAFGEKIKLERQTNKF